MPFWRVAVSVNVKANKRHIDRVSLGSLDWNIHITPEFLKENSKRGIAPFWAEDFRKPFPISVYKPPLRGVIHKKKTCWKICWKICWDLLNWENEEIGVVETYLKIKIPFQQVFQQVFFLVNHAQVLISYARCGQKGGSKIWKLRGRHLSVAL